MRIRWPFVRRKAHDLRVADLLMQIADYVGKLALASIERRQLEDELSRLRVHFEDTVKAKDEAYLRLMGWKDEMMRRAEAAEARLDSFGVPPDGWEYSAPWWATIVVTSDINGITSCRWG